MYIAKGAVSLFSAYRLVSGKLIEITKNWLRGLTSTDNYLLEGARLLGQFWESWKKEMADVVYKICRAFGVKHWTELVIRLSDPDSITKMACTLIAERRSLVECGSTAMPSHQGQAISENSAVVGTNDGPNSLVDGETQICESYYDEILAKFVDRQMFRNSADMSKYMRFICKFVKEQLQEKKSQYEKSWKVAKKFIPDVKIEDFNKEYGISGNTNNHFLQEVFNEYKKEEQDTFILRQLAYEKQNAGTSAQEEEHGQGFLDSDGVRFYPIHSMRGLSSSGLLSEQQYREMAEKWTGQRADTFSIHMPASGDKAVIQVNDAGDVIVVQCQVEDGKVSGVAAVLHNPAE
jgi:hypothetical protein